MDITKEEFEDYIDKMIDGDAKAAYNVAYCYLKGEAVEQDDYSGFKYLKVSAGLGCVTAIYYMLTLYLGKEVNGLTIDRDYPKAIEWAKVLSFANSLFNVEPEEEGYIYIGKMELAVHYIKPDNSQYENTKGFIIMKELADMGFPDAQYYTALCYKNAIGTRDDYNAARQYASACACNDNYDVFGNQNGFKGEANQLYYGFVNKSV